MRFILGAATGLLIAAVIVGAFSIDTVREPSQIVGQGPSPTETTAPAARPTTETAQAPEAQPTPTEAEVSQPESAKAPTAEENKDPVSATAPITEPETATDQLAAKAPVDPIATEPSLNATEPEAGTGADTSNAPAWERNAVSYTLPADVPRIALVLENPETSDVPQDLILSLGLPVTMGISPTDNAAIAYGEQARAAGFEIVARLPLSDRRDPVSDANVIHPAMSADEIGETVQRLLTGMPQAIAVSGVGGRQVASNAGLIEAVMLALKPEGYAFLDDSGQRNAVATEIAQRLDTVALGDVRVASGTMTDDQVYRLLDAAAQAAETSGAVVVAAPASAAVLIGLQRWALERNGKPARLVPLSAVLSAR